MALVLADRVKETTTTTGTGTYTLAGAADSSFETFASIGNGNTTYYACTDGSDFEVGIGTYTASGTTLARTTILQSSNSDNAVNWGAGTKDIFCTQPAEKAVFLNASDNIELADNEKIILGTGSDLAIFHDGSNSAIIDQGTGGLFIRGTAINIDDSSSNDYITATEGGAVTLFHNGSARLITTSTGAKVTGGTGDGVLIIEADTDNVNESDTALLQLSQDGGLVNAYIGFDGVNNLFIKGTSTGDIQLLTATGEVLAKGTGNGAFELYHDNSKKLETTSSGATVTGELAATSLDISGDVDVDGTLEADAMTLNGTAITSTATLSTGISNNNVPKFTSGVADNDFLRVDGTAIEGRSASQVLSDIGGISASSTDTLTNKTLTTPVINGFSGTGNGTITGDLTLTSTDAGATENPTLDLYRNSASPADNDVLGHIHFSGENDADQKVIYNEIESRLIDASDGTEDGRLVINTMTGGSLITHYSTGFGFNQFHREVLLASGINLQFEGATSDGVRTTVTVADPSSNRTITLPDATGTVSLLTNTETLTNKTLTTPVINGFSGTGDGSITGDLTLTSTDAGASENPTLDLYRNSSSPADSDILGHINFSGENSAGEKIVYAEVESAINDQTDGTEDGEFIIRSMLNGTLTKYYSAGFGSNIMLKPISFTAGASTIFFEGTTNNSFETSFTVTDPTADRTITLPDATGTVLLADGDGSSLTNVNATTLDSVDSTSFLRSDAADTKTSGNLQFSDNVRLRLGSSGSSDLQIWHDGTNSNIVNGTGDLIIGDSTGDVKIQGKYGEQSIIANNDGSVELYHDNSKKLETASGGISVTGEIAATSLDISGDVDVDGTLEADAITLNGTSLAASATTDTTNASNISSGTLPNARLDAQLQDVAGLAVTNGNFIVGDGSNFVAESGSTARTSLGLGTIATQAADSVNIDGGAIDGVTLGTNSAITEAQIDDFNFNGNSVNVSDTLTGFVIRVNDQYVARFQSTTQTVGGGGLYLYQNNPFITFEGATADGHETNLKVTDPTADRDITLPDATGTVSLLTNTETLTNKTLTTPVINGFSGTGNGSITGDLTLTSTDGGATENPTLDLYRNSASPADNDVIGHINFSGENSAGEKIVYAKINADIADQTDGTEDGRIDFNVVTGGSDSVRLSFRGNSDTSFHNKNIRFAQNVDLIFEGATSNDFETTLTVVDPTADRTVTLPNASGTVLLTDGSGANLTSLNASQLTSGTVPNARLDAQLQDVAGLAVTNGNFIVGDGSNFVAESGSTARDSLSLGTSSDVQFDSFGVGTAASGTTGEIRATADITSNYSDERLKNIHGTIPNALDKVKSLGGYYFTENEIAKSLGYDNDAQQVGVIAQEVEKVLPEAVKPAPIDDKYLTVQYEKMVPLLIEAMKEQQAKIEELESRLAKLEA